MSTNYEPLDLDEINKEADRIAAKANTGKKNNNDEFLKKFVQVPQRNGFLLMRLLPRAPGKKLYCATRTHRLCQDADGKGGRTFHCPNELTMSKYGHEYYNGPCVICKLYRDMWKRIEGFEKSGMKEKAEQLKPKARLLRANERYYFNVMVHDYHVGGVTEKKAGPLIFSCGKKVFELILSNIGTGINPTTGKKKFGDVTDPFNGRDFRLIVKYVKGDGDDQFYPNYEQSAFEDTPSALGDKTEIDQFLSNMHDLEALRVLKPLEEMDHWLKVHTGKISDSSTNFDRSQYEPDDEAPVVKVREDIIKPASEVEVKPAAAKDDAEDILADADFMKELDTM